PTPQLPPNRHVPVALGFIIVVPPDDLRQPHRCGSLCRNTRDHPNDVWNASTVRPRRWRRGIEQRRRPSREEASSVRAYTACLTFVAIVLPSYLSCGAQEEFRGKTRKVVKTDAEWAKQLTRPQFLVTRRKATEPAFSGRYVRNHAKGIY